MLVNMFGNKIPPSGGGELGDVTPGNMTDYTVPFPFVASASTELSSPYRGWKVFDGGAGFWLNTNIDINNISAPMTVVGAWIAIGFGSTKNVTEYTLQRSTNNLGRNPKDWTIYDFDDNIIDTRTEQTDTASDTRTYQITPVNITGFRMLITKTQLYEDPSDIGVGYVELKELIIRGYN